MPNSNTPYFKVIFGVCDHLSWITTVALFKFTKKNNLLFDHKYLDQIIPLSLNKQYMLQRVCKRVDLIIMFKLSVPRYQTIPKTHLSVNLTQKINSNNFFYIFIFI